MDRIPEPIAPLYRRLPRGPHTLGREAVVRNQRARLYGAMIESVSRHGYDATTVARVIALAGVSRRAFYEHFANKEECFLATYDHVVARARRRMLTAWASERGWSQRLRAAFHALLDQAADAPAAAHLVLVDGLGIGTQARERLELAGFTFERLIARALAHAPSEAGFSAGMPRAVIGGLRHVAFRRTLEQRQSELPALAGDVFDWIDCYRSPMAARLNGRGVVRAQPPPQPAAFLAREGCRAKLLGAVVHLTLDGGYGALSDPQIADFAGVSTEAFHSEFADKEACYLAVLDEFVGEALDSVAPRMRDAESWPRAVHVGIAAFVEYLVTHRALLQIAFVDLFELGAATIGRMTRSVEALTKLLTDGAPAPIHGPAIALEAVTGAVWAMIGTCVAMNGASALPALVDELAFTVLAPYIGQRAAHAALAPAGPAR